jgi:hypothetical protein
MHLLDKRLQFNVHLEVIKTWLGSLLVCPVLKVSSAMPYRSLIPQFQASAQQVSIVLPTLQL